MPHPPDHLGTIPPPVVGNMLSSPTTPSTWHACPLTRGLERNSLLTFYFDVKITDTVVGNSQLKAVMEIIKNKLPFVEEKLKPKNMKELYVEVCLDWMAATSFRFPDLVSLENLEKELGPILRRCTFNRFLLKISFVRLPSAITFLNIEGTGTQNGLRGKVYSTNTSIHKNEGSKIDISDCFRIVEKGSYSSGKQWKFVFDIQLTKETALHAMPKSVAWCLLLLDLTAKIYEKNEEIKNQADMYFVELDSLHTINSNFSREDIGNYLECLNLKRMTLKIVFYPKTGQKNGGYSEEEDLQELIENYASQLRTCGMPSSLSCPSYSHQEISRETWGMHTMIRSFSIQQSRGSPKSYSWIVVDLARKQLPRILALLGQDILIGVRLNSGKMEIYIDFVEHEHLTEKYISSFGSLKPNREFKAHFIFISPKLTRTERLIDEVARFRKKIPDSNGNFSPVEESSPIQQNNQESATKWKYKKPISSRKSKCYDVYLTDEVIGP